jgi:hypothetical protein
MKTLKSICLLLVSGLLLFISSCSKDDPKPEDIAEIITKTTLTFTPTGGGTPVIVSATDPDGDGPKPRELSGPINLTKSATYQLSITLINELAKTTDPEYDVTKEIEEDGVSHQFFFGWSKNVFSNPSGDGNIDNRTDLVLYQGGQDFTSKDENGRNLGLVTTWTSALSSIDGGTFTLILKHQPDNLKTDTSDSTTGETDIELTFTINII